MIKHSVQNSQRANKIEIVKYSFKILVQNSNAFLKKNYLINQDQCKACQVGIIIIKLKKHSNSQIYTKEKLVDSVPTI